MIRPAEDNDGTALARIYNHYILNSVATFEDQPVSAEEMSSRVRAVTSAGFPYLAAEADGMILGYAYATRWKERAAYRYAVESTVYLDPAHLGQGHGSTLYRALLAELADKGFHLAIAGISLPNEASIALHEKLGFLGVGRFSEVGYKFGRWIDVGYWQCRLNGAATAG